MNVALLLAAVVLAFSIDGGLIEAIGFVGLVPSLPMILTVFLALHAPRDTVPWLGWGMGMIADLTTPYLHGTGGAWPSGPVLGPNALGWCFGAYVIMLVRAMLYRRQVHTVAVMTLVFALAANLVSVFVLAMHDLYEPVPIGWAAAGPARELLDRLGAGLYSALLALVMGPLLHLTMPAWRFRQPMPRAVARRA